MYVLIKILKFCTASSTKSYQCKFAINYVITSNDVAVEDLGKVIKEVIHYRTLRGKFSSVHPELGREGITQVEVGEEGFVFIRDSGALWGSIFRCSSLNKKNEILTLGDAEEDFREPTMHHQGKVDENEEEELLRQAIALSLEEAEEEKD